MNWWKIKGFLLAITILVFALSIFGVFIAPTVVKVGLTSLLAVASFMTGQYFFAAFWFMLTILALIF